MINKNKNDLIESFRVKCKQHNLNITPQRVAIYQELIASDDHPDSDGIFDRVKKVFPEISLDTVYRTLAKFAQIGVAHLVEGYGESKRYDPDINTHHHLRCKRCNKIIDFHNEDYNKLKVPKSLAKNFHVTNVKVVLEGICSQCAKKR